MVRLQSDLAKPAEKRFNYKHCFDALFRVSYQSPLHVPSITRRFSVTPLSSIPSLLPPHFWRVTWGSPFWEQIPMA